MAYTIEQLIIKYNCDDAVMLSNLIQGRYGILSSAHYNIANKQLAHTYANYTTLPSAGIRSLGDGVAASTVQGTENTQILSLFNANGAWDQAFVGNDLDGFYKVQSPLYFNAVAQAMQKGYIYGSYTSASYKPGIAGYTNKGWHQYVKHNSMSIDVGATKSATSIFAVRWSPVQNVDGASLIVDPLTYGNLFYINENWVDPIPLSGKTGSFIGHAMHFNNNSVCLMPGSNNIAAIRGINTSNQPTVGQMDQLLNLVKADLYTVLYVNAYGASVLGILGKDQNLTIQPNQFGYSNQLHYWNGVPIVITDTIRNDEDKALYDDTGE